MIILTKTIKLIDLFIKIAKGEDTPEKIKFQGNIYSHNGDTGNSYYYCEKNGKLLEDVFIFEELNDEVEIIEDRPKEDTPKEDKKIEKLDYCEENTLSNLKEPTYLSVKERQLIDSTFKTIKEKFDEIINKINGE